ncbi:MAG: DUF4280 domain-containing protein [Eubacterium sp.]|nr:DUF4280 domain-containing protein [Eubacterium sp.]
MSEKNEYTANSYSVMDEVNQMLNNRIEEITVDTVICNNYICADETLSENERTQKINEYMSLHCELDKLLYLSGSLLLECEWGLRQVECVPGEHNIQFNGNSAFSSMDCKVGEHINCFGICIGQSEKEGKDIICEPQIAHNQWMNFCSSIVIGDANAINEDSYLICTKCEGGIISPTPLRNKSDSKAIEEIIEDLIAQIDGGKISEYNDMVALPTVEILARMIYQENHHAGDEQNRIVFSVINRLFQDGYLAADENGESKVNNLYGIVTSGKQYESIWNVEQANENTKKGNHNAYWPPIEKEADPTEKEGWENAKKLAALLYYAVEEYGDGEETERGKCVGDEKTMEVKENIVNFLESQEDIKGDLIINTLNNETFFGAGGENKNDFR